MKAISDTSSIIKDRLEAYANLPVMGSVQEGTLERIKDIVTSAEEFAELGEHVSVLDIKASK